MNFHFEVLIESHGQLYTWFNTPISDKFLRPAKTVPLQFEIPSPPEGTKLIIQIRRPIKKW